MQLTDGCKFNQNAIDNSHQESEQVGCPMFPGVVKTKRKLDIDDEFEKDKVNIGHLDSLKAESEVCSQASDSQWR
jgi:hypothetical protein